MKEVTSLLVKILEVLEDSSDLQKKLVKLNEQIIEANKQKELEMQRARQARQQREQRGGGGDFRRKSY